MPLHPTLNQLIKNVRFWGAAPNALKCAKSPCINVWRNSADWQYVFGRLRGGRYHGFYKGRRRRPAGIPRHLCGVDSYPCFVSAAGGGWHLHPRGSFLLPVVDDVQPSTEHLARRALSVALGGASVCPDGHCRPLPGPIEGTARYGVMT